MSVRDVRKSVSDIIKEYGFDPRHPGKFEGEPIETLYYYDSTMNGFGEDRGVEGEMYSIHGVTADERKVFQMPDNIRYFVISENEQGFVYGSAMTKKRYNKFIFEIDELEQSYNEEE